MLKNSKRICNYEEKANYVKLKVCEVFFYGNYFINNYKIEH